jgi:hypothetical protein
VFLLHNLGKTYGCRPSAILGIDDPWAGYQLDLVCLTTGSEVEAAIMKGQSIEQALGPSEPRRGSKSRAREQFRDPTPFVSQKMRIPESGVW